MPSKNDKAAERAQLNEADMEERKAPGRSGGPARARRCGRTAQAKEKTPLGGSAQVLDEARFGQGNPSFSLGWAWLDLAGFG
jgi:hypothetical protein